MSLALIEQLLAWCSVINLSILTLWFVLFVFVHDSLYRLHSRWFTLSTEQFNNLHYLGMMLFKLAIFLFNLVPYLVLHFIM